MVLKKRAWARLASEGLLAGSVVIVALGPLLEGADGSSGSHLSNTSLWNCVLALSLKRDEAAKTNVEKILAREKLAEPVKRLAMLILEEWDLPPSDQQLTSPYPVWSPKLDVGELAIESPLVVILGLVQSDGSFLPKKIKVSSGNPEVDKRCFEVAQKALFRPARQGNSYTKERAALSFHLYI